MHPRQICSAPDDFDFLRYPSGRLYRLVGVLGRVQTGNLQLYAFLVLIGIVATVAWSWSHG